MTAAAEVGPRPAAVGSPWTFFAATFAVTWTCFVTAAVLSQKLPEGAGPSPGLWVLLTIGTFAPALVALALTGLAEGRAGVAALLARLFRWEVQTRWYVFAISYIAAIKLLAALVLRLATGAWPRFGAEPWFLMLAAMAFSTLLGGQTGEEIGWRGYALPRLATRFGLGWASIVLGVIWACWHLPLFFMKGADLYQQSFPLYLLQVTAISVAIAWLYWRTGGSLLLTMLLHAAINNTKDIVPSVMARPPGVLGLHASGVGWLTLAMLWACATAFLVQMRRARLDGSVDTEADPEPGR